MGPPAGGTDKTAKEVLDKIGEAIEKQVHDSAVDHINDLQGDLSRAKFRHGTSWEQANKNVCGLKHTHDTNVRWGVIHPCDNRLANLYSEESASQCSTSRISGNDTNSGSCAPYRKLQLCDYNLEKITDTNVTNTHNLLVDVLLAAKHEGDSLSKYMKENNGPITNSNICTILARSFADIGDIVRGKDLYIGNRKEKEKVKLQENLKNIFKKIYNDVTTNGKNEKAKERYKDDGGDFFQLREDWWNANRREVWKAMTCDAPEDAKYFRSKCSGEHPTNKKCQCVTHDVPTYLDYVPQFLRWFEEWVEEFCRIKKLKLENVKKYCRDDKAEKYCSGNGLDCTKTVRAKGDIIMGNNCTNCLVACNPYKDWINNKKKEFDKQKKKCENEIYSVGNSKKQSTSSTNKLYYDKFYEKLEIDYGNLEAFLKLLNEENTCKSITEAESKIDFSKTSDKDLDHTFYASEYCKPCPICGGSYQNGKFISNGEEEEKCNHTCIDSEPPENGDTTEINVLYIDKKSKDMLEKIKNFCNGDVKNNEWKCYHDETHNKDFCVLKDEENVICRKKRMEYYHFFEFWVTHVLNDTINWKNKIKKCLNPGKSSKCNSACNRNCKCFKSWVEKKKNEWEEVKKHFEKQEGLIKGFHYSILEGVLKVQFLPTIEEAYGDIESMKKIEKFLEEESTHKDSELKDDKKDAIDFLLDHELEEADLCLQTHPEEEKCADKDDDSDDDEHEEEVYVNNPCAKPSGNYPALAHNVAYQMHEKAKTQLSSRAGRSLLRGDASEGHYSRGGEADDIKNGAICKITAKHSNDSRRDGGPCTGKDGNNVRFQIGTPWKGEGQVSTSYKDVFLPPRREHFCTSNLEYLQTSMSPLNGSDKDPKLVNNSFLGDVLLSANKQVEWIKKNYKDQRHLNDNETMCRAVKYSFADLGDIIRGRDLWDINSDATGLQSRLENIFKNINEKLPDGIQKKYNDGKHLNLRSDWWEANRHQVWKSMQCALKSGNEIQCNNHAPYDDYIPQRLRWMTEWAEWFCKAQKEEYENLVKQCSQCKSKGKGDGKDCTQKDKECALCKGACDAYNTKIRTWKKQWQNMQVQYTLLYWQAETITGPTAFIGNEKDQHVVEFFKELQKTIKNSASKRSKRSIDGTTTDPTLTSPYKTAEGYIHQELTPYLECQKQNQFCEKKNGETPSSDEKDNDKEYAFRSKPYDHDNACACEKNKPKPLSTRPQEHWLYGWRTSRTPRMFLGRRRNNQKTTCEIVAEMLKDKNGTIKVGECHQKVTDSEWKCDDNKIKSTEVGACMPPRREKLCVHYLKQSMTNSDGLKKAFLKCAGAETFLSWQNYKKDKNGNANNLDNTLKGGNIPEEFKRQMFYTFADYRDLCLDTDLSSITDIHSAVSIAKDNIYKVFKKIGQSSIDHRKSWWETNGPVIWEGMLCGLSNVVSGNDKGSIKNNNKYSDVTFSAGPSGTKLTEFAERTQFLRWFTEWGENFCKEQKKQLDQLVNVCKECNVSDSDTKDNTKICNDKENCDTCKRACTKYQTWLKDWKTQYEKQSKKYTDHKVNHLYKIIDDVKNSPNAFEYLYKQLKHFICENGDCNCMENSSKQQKQSSTDGDKMPESLDEKPEKVKDKCNCVLHECSGLSVTDSGIPDGSAFGGGLPPRKCKGLEGGPQKKIEPPTSDYINDILKSTIPVGIALALGSITFLFIKVIYIYVLFMCVCMLCVYAIYIYIYLINVFILEKKKRKK